VNLDINLNSFIVSTLFNTNMNVTGQIDDIQIWNYVFNKEQVIELPNIQLNVSQ